MTKFEEGIQLEIETLKEHFGSQRCCPRCRSPKVSNEGMEDKKKHARCRGCNHEWLEVLS
jgi:transposase-like protein